jgi:hypothetical protein
MNSSAGLTRIAMQMPRYLPSSYPIQRYPTRPELARTRAGQKCHANATVPGHSKEWLPTPSRAGYLSSAILAILPVQRAYYHTGQNAMQMPPSLPVQHRPLAILKNGSLPSVMKITLGITLANAELPWQMQNYLGNYQNWPEMQNYLGQIAIGHARIMPDSPKWPVVTQHMNIKRC